LGAVEEACLTAADGQAVVTLGGTQSIRVGLSDMPWLTIE
jgi:hypothetical protein